MNWIDRCLYRLTGLPVLIVDNGSSDGTVDYVLENYPEVELIVSEKNLGFGAANNIGLKRVRDRGYDFAYLLNQDAWIDRKDLELMMDSWPEGYGIISPVQKSADGKLDPRFAVKCGKQLSKALRNKKKIAEVPFVMAAHWLVSRETIEKVGGFSPVFHQYGEDDNYIDRVHFHGLKVGICIEAQAVHDRGDRPFSKEKRMKLKCISTLVRLSDPSSNRLAKMLWSPIELIGMAIKNASSVPLRYIPELLENYPEILKARDKSVSELW